MQKKTVSRISVSLPPDLQTHFDRFMGKKRYATRSKAIADLMREALMREEWSDDGAEVFGAVTFVYDHHTPGLSDKLTEIQHDHFTNIISSTHIHLDHHRCLEIVVLRGPVKQVQGMGEQMIATRGVLHGKLVLVATGAKS